MKRRVLFGTAFIFITWAFTSCEALTSCKICKQVTYENGSVILEGSESEYCDAKLAAIEATADVVTGNKRLTWECR